MLLLRSGGSRAGRKSDQLLKDADTLFDRLLDAYPKSPYAGDAFVRRIDFALERKFDLKTGTIPGGSRHRVGEEPEG